MGCRGGGREGKGGLSVKTRSLAGRHPRYPRYLMHGPLKMKVPGISQNSLARPPYEGVFRDPLAESATTLHSIAS